MIDSDVKTASVTESNTSDVEESHTTEDVAVAADESITEEEPENLEIINGKIFNCKTSCSFLYPTLKSYYFPIVQSKCVYFMLLKMVASW